MNDWRIPFTTIPGRRPRLAVAILLSVMLTFVLAQKFAPLIGYAWIPVGMMLLVFLFHKLGWLAPMPNTTQLPDVPPLPRWVVNIITALAGLMLLTALYILHRTMTWSAETAIIAVYLIVGIGGLVLWLNFRNESQ